MGDHSRECLVAPHFVGVGGFPSPIPRQQANLTRLDRVASMYRTLPASRQCCRNSPCKCIELILFSLVQFAYAVNHTFETFFQFGFTFGATCCIGHFVMYTRNTFDIAYTFGLCARCAHGTPRLVARSFVYTTEVSAVSSAIGA